MGRYGLPHAFPRSGGKPFIDGCEAFAFGGSCFLDLRGSFEPLRWPFAMFFPYPSFEGGGPGYFFA